MAEPTRPRHVLVSDTAIIVYLALLTLALHFATNNRYGYHRDELYFIACGQHLAWGYVDHAPLVPLIARLSGAVFGYSLFGLRFLPAVAGALLVLLTGLMVRELGGGRFGQFLGALSALVAPVFLRADNMLCLPAFEQLLWALCCYVVILLIKKDNPRLWPLIGLLVGVGLLTKHSILFFVLGLAAGMLLTRQRKFFLSPWLWGGVAIAFVIFLPNLVWQMSNGWPTLEFLRNLNRAVMARISPLEFLAGQVLYINPVNFPVWVAGLCYFLFAKDGARYRLFGWSYLAVIALLIAAKSKVYYLTPAYPVLLAGGALVLERFGAQAKRRWFRPAFVAWLVAGGVVMAPLGLPILPIERLEGYTAAVTGNLLKNSHEVVHDYRDMFGWQNLVRTVARVYNSLPPEQRAKCPVFAGNYGEAAAIDLWGARYGLPHAISGDKTYYLWGPGNQPGELVLVLGVPADRLKGVFGEIRKVGLVRSPHALENHVPIYLGTKIRAPLREIWPVTKSYGP